MDDTPSSPPSLTDLMARAEAHAATFDDGDLTALPRLRLALLTCVDCRIMPDRILGLRAGDAKVVRNAGGRASADAIRSLVVVTRLLGVRRILVMHHTDCGNAGTDEEVAAKLRGAGVTDVPSPLHANTDPEGAVREDVERLRAEPGLADGTEVDGAIYDVRTGRLQLV